MPYSQSTYDALGAVAARGVNFAKRRPFKVAAGSGAAWRALDPNVLLSARDPLAPVEALS